MNIVQPCDYCTTPAHSCTVPIASPSVRSHSLACRAEPKTANGLTAAAVAGGRRRREERGKGATSVAGSTATGEKSNRHLKERQPLGAEEPQRRKKTKKHSVLECVLFFSRKTKCNRYFLRTVNHSADSHDDITSEKGPCRPQELRSQQEVLFHVRIQETATFSQ